MEILPQLFVFLFGTIIGSFLNVVALRYNTGLSLGGRSSCFVCRKTLLWYELVPVVSYVCLAGKCHECHSRISPQYPCIEFLTGLLFLIVYLQNLSLVLTLLYFCTISILIVITIYDLRHKIIPNGLVYAFIALALLKLIVTIPFSNLFHFPYVLDLFAGPILYIPFFLLWFLSGGEWMGYGDAKLAWGIGWFLGIVYGTSAVILGFWIGALFSVFVLIIQKTPLSFGSKRLTMKSEIPFAPFLILGTLLALFLQIDILGLRFFLI